MSIGDWCTPLENQIYHTNIAFPQRHDPNNTKPLRGIKCPRGLENIGEMHKWSKVLPKTKIIVGIRHPVLWFQSFYNMQTANGKHRNPYTFAYPRCNGGPKCRNSCRKPDLFCVERSRFHIALARLGKTPLTEESELQYLPDLFRHKNRTKVQNTIFLYETRST